MQETSRALLCTMLVGLLLLDGIECVRYSFEVRQYRVNGVALSDAHKIWAESAERAALMAGRNGVQM